MFHVFDLRVALGPRSSDALEMMQQGNCALFCVVDLSTYAPEAVFAGAFIITVVQNKCLLFLELGCLRLIAFDFISSNGLKIKHVL